MEGCIAARTGEIRGNKRVHRSVFAAFIGIWGAAAAHAAESTLPSPDAERAKVGRAVYRQHCASCHGAQAEGAPNWQQPDPKGDMPAPPHNAKGHTWKHSDATLYRIVMQGWRDPFNKTEQLTMPGFSGVLSPKEARAVVAYFRILWTPEQRRFQREESRRAPFPN